MQVKTKPVKPPRHYLMRPSRFLGAVIVLVVFQFADDGQNVSAKDAVLKKNYLESVILQTTGLEKEFLIALKNQRGSDALLESLGLMQVENKTAFGTGQEPGRAPVALQVDAGETAAINARRKLVWHETFKERNQTRQLLIFDQTNKKWPGLQPITIVLLDDKLNVLAWVESGGLPMFKTAALDAERKPHLLKVISDNRNRAIVTEQFEIKEQAIVKVTQPVGASLEGSHCGDTHLTSAETDILMKSTALIQREKGDTNQPSPVWLAFQKHLKFGGTAKPQIQELLDKGSPAGRLYGAILLKQIDPASAVLALNKMKEDKTPVNYIVGCGVEATTTGALAGRIMKGEELVQLKAQAQGARDPVRLPNNAERKD